MLTYRRNGGYATMPRQSRNHEAPSPAHPGEPGTTGPPNRPPIRCGIRHSETWVGLSHVSLRHETENWTQPRQTLDIYPIARGATN